jgi:cytochrome c551/c552
MNIFVVDERFERPIKVGAPRGIESWSAKACGKCHREIYSEWAESMHGQAWTDPYFQVDFRYDGSQQICLNCHTPLVNQQQSLVLGFRDRDKFDPILAPNPEYDAALRDEGVTCVVCHIRNGRIVGPFRTERVPHAV